MTNLRKVWPRPGVIVVDPATGRRLEDGATVRSTSYMMRRIADGDLLEEEPKPQRKAEKKPRKGGSASSEES